MQTAHLDRDILARYMVDHLPLQDAAVVTAHLADCSLCQGIAIEEGDIAIQVLSLELAKFPTELKILTEDLVRIDGRRRIKQLMDSFTEPTWWRA
jgi:hypothetical protein